MLREFMLRWVFLPLLDQAADDAESVVKRSGGFFQDEFVAASNDDGNGFANVLDSSNLNETVIV